MLCCLMVSSAYADDYFDRITMASNGRLTRFNRNLITVYADAIPLDTKEAEAYERALTQSLKLWEEATEGKLRFRFVPAAVAANIQIKWGPGRREHGAYDTVGQAMLIRKAEGFHVEIEIFLRHSTTLKLLSPELVQSALLHEIGHAIGLWGHSENPDDAMYFAAKTKAPTVRDVATWLKVNSTPFGAPFHHQAIQALKAEIQKNSEAAKHHYLIGMVYADEGNYHDAIDAFQHALKIDPLFRFSAVQIAQIFQQEGMYELAIKHYTQALRTKPSTEVLGALGTLSLLQGQFDRAVDFFQQALRRAPDSVTLNQNLLATYHRWGFQLLKSGRLTEATRCFNRGLGRFPFSEILLYDLAVTYESAGEYNRALDIYQRVLRIDPEYAAAKIGLATTLNNLGAQHAQNKDWEGAIEFYQRALEYDPGCQQAHQNLEATLMRMGWERNTDGDIEGAILTYRKVVALFPKNAQAHNNLGVIFFKKRDYKSATACFGAALELDAGYEEAQANLNHVKSQYAYDTVKRVLLPVLVVLLVSFIIMKVNAKRVDSRMAVTRGRKPVL